MKILSETITIKENELKYYNDLLSLIDLDEYSEYMEDLINQYSAKKDDYIGVACVRFKDNKEITIDIASGSSNYYDNIVLWEIKNDGAYELYVCDCEYELGKDFEIEHDNTIYRVHWNIIRK